MKAYVYAIRSHQTNKIYIGSTTQALSMRMCGHRRNYKEWMNGKFHFVTSFEILKFEDNYIELLQEVEVESKLELRRVEGENIRKHDCVNKIIAGRTKVEYDAEHKEQKAEYDAKYNANHKEQKLEYNAEYNASHKEEIAEQRAVYRKVNKEQIAEHKAVPYTCACGSVCTTSGKSRHEKTKKHQAFVTQSVIPSANIL